MLIGIYMSIINTTQYVLNLHEGVGNVDGVLTTANFPLDFAGIMRNNTLYAVGSDECKTRLQATLFENPTRCQLKIDNPCTNMTVYLDMTGFSENEYRKKNIHLLEYGLYAIILCLIASFIQYRSMSELRAEKIVDISLQVNLIFDVVILYILLATDAEYLDTRSAMIFYWGVNIFFQTRLVNFVEKSWFTCVFWGSLLFVTAKVHPGLGFILIFGLILMWSQQIWFCFYHGVTPGFQFAYLASNFARLFPALYAWGCPYNLVNFGYHHNQGFILLGLVTILTSFIIVQYFHPRFKLDRIPLLKTYLSKVLKSTHNYVSELADDDDKTCGICLEEFDQPGEGYQLLNRVMRAPCDHIFHERCLQEWLQVKLQCPICRVEMPPI